MEQPGASPIAARVSGTPPLLVLGKIRQILECFSIEEPALTLREITQRTRLPSSTTQRFVYNLVREGFLDRDDEGYRIGTGFVRWAAPGTAGLNLVRKTESILQALRDQTGETACLYVRDRSVRTVVSVAQTRHVLMRYFAIGMTMPMNAGAGARIFLAYDPLARADLLDDGLRAYTSDTPLDIELLDRDATIAKEQGFFVTQGELYEGVASVCAPVFDHTGDLAAVLGLSTPALRAPDHRIQELIPQVVAAAQQASVALGHPSGGASL